MFQLSQKSYHVMRFIYIPPLALNSESKETQFLIKHGIFRSRQRFQSPRISKTLCYTQQLKVEAEQFPSEEDEELVVPPFQYGPFRVGRSYF